MRHDPIHVLHLTPQLSRAGGGAAAYLWELVKHTAAHGVVSHVAGVADDFTAADVDPAAAASVFAGKATLDPKQGFSRELRRYLEHDLPAIDLVHSHGLRSGIGLEALRVVRRRNVPLLISPHGMLYPDLLRRGRFKKWLVNRLWDTRYRAAAKAFHATSSAEATVLREHGVKQRIAVVPIGIDIARFNATRSAWLEQRCPQLQGKRRVLFLGIMDRKKGLLRLAAAWGELAPQHPDWHLVIAGPDVDGHEAEVRAALERVGAASAATFIGGVYGSDKAQLYGDCDLFVLPTDWENFGIAVAEALASGLPVITTTGTPWQELPEHRCGWWIAPTADELRNTLTEAFTLPDDARRAMGARGRELVATRYAWDAIAARMTQVYAWMIGTGEPPPISGTGASPVRKPL